MHVCAQWSVATSEVVPGGIGTGVAVIPIGYWSPASMASAAATVSEITAGKFVLGIGAGALQDGAFRHSLGLDDRLRPIATMREWLVTLRALLAGETVEHEGRAITLLGVTLGSAPPKVPVALGALGPKMLTLAGEAADAAALNWCTPEQVSASRETVAAGAREAGRDPSEVAMIEYIRICVDDDVDAARRAYVKALMGYALARPGTNKALGYRGHFGRMGFDEALTELEDRRGRGASEEELIEAFPVDLALLVGYFGPASGAASAFRHLAEGLDTAIVRVVAARPALESITAVMQACQPARLGS
jgi:alkanesulfonate monooxygenase SsuD/methylene tetrahydromethanopterin reductase-like flavin-dependent oxidoreductase (luciferase family)